MPRGGTRPGAGRKPGATATTNDLLRHVRNRMRDGNSLNGALASVCEDVSVPVEVRIAATRRLAGALFGHVVLTARDQEAVDA